MINNDRTPADILREAAGYLARHGWHRGSLYGDGPDTVEALAPTPPACALGSISMAALGHRINAVNGPGHRDYQHASDVFADYLDHSGVKPPINDDGYGMSVGDWNDQPDRTVGEVIAALNAAADDWDRTHPTPTGPCSSGFCIASFCDGINHVDATGHTWVETNPSGVTQ